MPRPLKVFRTSVGFDDAYVAAPSRAAALRAWGSTKDLFAAGAAELVTDPALTPEPLAHPGEVIRRSRGSLKDQLAMLGPVAPSPDEPAADSTRKRQLPAKPSRTAVQKAEEAINTYREHLSNELDQLRRQEAELVRKREQLLARYEAELARLEQRRTREEDRYQAKLTEWARPGGAA